ncbi:hypothetical protein KM043_013401 [Ampulex compressa]|nr:hypothetical protein KM043_013401 [Ampulex compressa]
MTFEESWIVIRQAATEKKHELVLSGPAISEQIEKSGLDKTLFNLQSLNYLNITQTCLKEIPNELEKLQNLTSLVLHSNEITEIPKTIEKLTKLKVLDCSRNKLTVLPDEVGNLPHLTTMNFGSNQLKTLPSLISNAKLSTLDLSNNQFEIFPDVCYAELIHLSEIYINGNHIKEVPPAISQLASLKILNLADNSILAIPGELVDCTKLKELHLKGNALADKRLSKLVDQCRTKQILEYIKSHCPKSSPSLSANIKGKKGKKGQQHIQKVRPYIAACVVKNTSFSEDSFKKFIQLQTKLHDGICKKRNAATIATHDLKLITTGDLIYTAKPPTQLEIKPLMRNKTYTGSALYQQLQTEAENLRKENKRNTYSGIHKYLYLLEGKAVFPCLVDALEQVISFPPITNSDITKMSVHTEAMLIEVTSSTSYQICRDVLDQFLKDLVTQGLGCASEEKDNHEYHSLLVEQVKIVDMDGNLKLVYPSRADLNFSDNSVTVLRE